MTTSSENPPPGEVFKGLGLRNWLRTAGAGIFKAFTVGVDALKFIRENFGAIRTQDFYEIRREVGVISKEVQALIDYPGNQLIPLAWHKEDHGLILSSEYQYRIEIIGSDPFVGGLKTQFMTVASDRQLTTDEIQDVARSYVGEGGQSGEVVLGAFGAVTPFKR